MFVKIWEITLENTLAVSYEGKRTLSLWPISLHRNENISPHIHLYVNIHLETVLVTALTWKKPRSSSAGKQIVVLPWTWILLSEGISSWHMRQTWANMKIIMLSERSQTWKATYSVIQKCRDRNQMNGCQGLGKEGMNRRRLTAKKHRRPFGNDRNVLYLDCINGYMTAFIKSHETVLLRKVIFVACSNTSTNLAKR